MKDPEAPQPPSRRSPPELDQTIPQQQSTVLVRNNYGRHGYDVPVSPQSSDPESAGLLDYWRVLRRHKATWAVISFLGALIGILVTLPQTPVYQAHLSLEIVGLNQNFLNMKETSPINASGTSGDTTDIQTQVKLLQSSSLMERVIAKLEGSSTLTPEKSRFDYLRQIFNLPSLKSDNSQHAALAAAAKSLKVRVAGQTRVLELTIDSTNPQVAAQFANTLASEFTDQSLEARWQATQKTSDWLSRQLDDMRIKLERSDAALQDYARNAGILFTGAEGKTNVSEEKLSQLQTQLSAATADRIAKQSRYELAQTTPPDALPDVLNDTGLRDLHLKINELKRQIADLSAVYTPDYVKVKRAEADLSLLQQTFNQDRAAILDRIKNEYQEVARRENLLAAAYGIQNAEVSGQGERLIQYNILKREANSNRQLYDSMLQQLKESTIASAMRASNVRVVDPASTPKRPYKPDLVQSAGVGLLAGLFLGAAFVIMRDRADITIQQPGEAPYFSQAPELGIIPSGKSDPASKISLGRARLTDSPDRAVVELVTFDRQNSVLSEAFRSVLVSILFTSTSEDGPQVIVLTSAGPTEGKSTVASNLGIAISEVGKRVLLIDADLRRPRQHAIFSLDNEKGLTNFLRDRTPLNGDRTLGGMIHETEVPNLEVFPSGPTTSSATSLLYTRRMAELVKYTRESYDVVLIDTPPMLQIPDARVVGRMADKVILVVRSLRTSRNALMAACQRFQEDGTEVMGTILNDWNPKKSPDGYYGYYDKYSGGYYQRRDVPS